MNKTILVGRLTADPELRQTQSGVASCRFTVAVDRKFADKNSGEKQSDFITCVAWRQTAEFVSRYFNKGKMIALEGSLRTGKYQDKNHEDVTHYTTEVYVDNVEFVGSKGDGGQQTQTAPAKVETTPTEPVESANSEDIPF
jgi:single-strand DNA-binding protein